MGYLYSFPTHCTMCVDYTRICLGISLKSKQTSLSIVIPTILDRIKWNRPSSRSPSPEVKDEQAARRPKHIKFGGRGGGTGRVQVFHCPRKYGRLLVRELWIESVLKVENTSNLVSNKQKNRVGKMGQSYTSSKQKFSLTIRIHQVTIL